MKYLEFTEGSAGAYFDPNLLSKISAFLHLIPASKTRKKQHCDYVHCQKCGETVVHTYGSFETDDENENGDPIYENKIFYKCSCCKSWWWIDIDDYDRISRDIRSNWFWCKEPGIYPGYVDWHHQTYFHHLECFLSYCSENPRCSCYWPQANREARLISDKVYDDLFPMAEKLKENTPLFNEYLINRTAHGFLSGLLTNAFFYTNYREIFRDLAEFQNDYASSFRDAEETIQEKFLSLYTECLKKHPHPKIFYERGMTLFHMGQTLDSLSDIKELLAFAENHNYQEFLTSDLYLKEGQGLSETLSYDEAVISLTKALEKDPKNKEAYFERAFAYFEKGNFEQALADYLASGLRPNKIDPKKIGAFAPLKFSHGMLSGMIEGSKEALTEFVPSLLGSLQGLNRGLWAFVKNPIEISQDFLEASYACIEYIKENTSLENLSKLAPELQESLKKWDCLDHKTKGQQIGHVIGKYGVDIFMGVGSMKAVRAYRELRKANALLTLESLASSPKLQKEILAQCAREAKFRENLLKEGRLKIIEDRQGKHIPGKHNYEPGKSIFEHPNPQALIEKFAGSGKKLNDKIPGEPNYKEAVDFHEYIGIWKDEQGSALPTTRGTIHYSKKGVHIIPLKPS
ncbi:MAG: tetratricopeptide repeat protein [Chlamydiales bacterium]|nr:tetratricopeptide repeat protein [Chlamydiales bacterium]